MTTGQSGNKKTVVYTGNIIGQYINKIQSRLNLRLSYMAPVMATALRLTFFAFLPVMCTLFLTPYTSGAQAPVDTFTPPAPTVPKYVAESAYYDAVRARLRGDDKEAEELLNKVLSIDKDAAGAYFDLARISMKQNKIGKATDEIKKALAIDSTNPWYQSQYAEILIAGNKFEEAANVYSQLAANEKYNEEYLFKSAGLYIQTGKYKEAMAALDKIIEQEGEEEEWMMRKQELYLKMNDVEGAVKTIQKLIDRYPGEGRYYAIIANIYESNKQPEKAVEVYKKAEKLFADDALVQLSLSNYYKSQNDTAKYHEYLRKAITNKGLDPQQQLAILVDYIRSLGTDTSHKDEILSITRSIALQHPGNAEVLGIYGDILVLNGDRAAGAEQYKKSLDADPSRFPVWQNLLYQYADKPYADSLILYSSKALRMFPNQALFHFLKGVGHSNKGQYPEAIKAINRGIDMQPEDDENAGRLAEMYATLGDVYNSAKQYDKSDEAFKKALTIEPDNAFTLNNYSYFLSLRGDNLDEAERMSKRSLELRPGTTTFMDTYGWILYKQGKYEKAKEYIEKAVNAEGKNADGTLLEHLGDVMFRLKDTDKAVELWQKAKEKGADNPDIDKKIRDRKIYE